MSDVYKATSSIMKDDTKVFSFYQDIAWLGPKKIGWRFW